MNFGVIEMEVDFDKQIDTILRDLAKGKTLAESPPVSHLDADELSAFAENALPPKARLRAMEHLADCQNCRKFLSTFALLSEEIESEVVQEAAKTIAAIPEIPWYRKLFAFPAISYAMGAMALLLVGTIGFLVLQNSQDTANSVAKNEPVAEKVKGPSGVSSDGEAPSSDVYSANAANAASNTAIPAANIASSSANSATVSNSAVSSANTVTDSEPKPTAAPLPVGSPTPSAPTSADKSTGSADRDASKDDAIAAKGGEKESKSANEVASAPITEKQTMDDNLSQRAETTQNRAVQNQIMTPDGGETRRSVPSAPPMAKKVPAREDINSGGEGARMNKSEPKPSSTRTVAGKTFSNEKGIWTDSSYRGGSTINVKRGTDEYKKLDSGLRSTADYLGGTVIIVWKDKNYKIQ